MPVKHTVKRNSLSSKWGVWATDTDAQGQIENLVAEFKSGETAETYRTRIEAGESHNVIIEDLTAKKSKPKGSGGMFGKLFKKGSSVEHVNGTEEKTVKNPVIEIQAPSKSQSEKALMNAEEGNHTPTGERKAAKTAGETQSRFHVIQQSAPEKTEEPIVTDGSEPEIERIDRTMAREAAMAAALKELRETKARAAEEAYAKANAEDSQDNVDELTSTKQAAPQEADMEVHESELTEPDVIDTPQSTMPSAEPAKAEQTLLEVTEPTPVEAMAVESEFPGMAEKSDQEQQLEQTKAIVKEEPLSQVESAETITKEPTPAHSPDSVQPPQSATTLIEQKVVPQRETSPNGMTVANEQRVEPSREDGLLVDWTFTPPPDVTPAELKNGTTNGIPVSTRRTTSNNAIDPEWSSRPQPTPSKTDGIDHDPDTGRVTVDICLSKTLKDSSQGDPRVSDKKYNSIASKEYTEVSKAFATGNNPEHLQEELTHLAAVCLAWADALKKRMSLESKSKVA